MMDLLQEHAVNIAIAATVLWLLWRRIIAPKLAGVRAISAVDYQQFKNSPHTLIDVRTLGEWQHGHAPSAKHIPLSELSHNMREIAADKPVVVICASGMRSSSAALQLAKADYKEVYNFSGGMASWQNAGLPLSQKG